MLKSFIVFLELSLLLSVFCPIQQQFVTRQRNSLLDFLNFCMHLFLLLQFESLISIKAKIKRRPCHVPSLIYELSTCEARKST